LVREGEKEWQLLPCKNTFYREHILFGLYSGSGSEDGRLVLL
jgi:hypothetical protein